MYKILQLGLIIVTSVTYFPLGAQSSKCATMEIHKKRMLEHPDLKDQMIKNELATQQWLAAHSALSRTEKQIIKIPVVFHIIWHDSIENVSDQQVYSQLDVLNADYRLMNKDSLPVQHPFHKFVGDAGIAFCLATIDPNGNPSSGITRTYTSVTSWQENSLKDIKSTARGGHDNWLPTQYLNIYVVNMQGETLGFASFPDELVKSPEQDGVVIRYEAFGTIGTAGRKGYETNNKGRTATHEVGHWLNLIHIWGDQMCGDDKVADTAPAEDENKFCPTFPQRPNNRCGSDANGEMYMNYMDYVEDSCMVMFTAGQSARMFAAINIFRSSILNSKACMVTSLTEENKSNSGISVYPNPNNGIFTCSINQPSGTKCTLSLYNYLGEQMKKWHGVASGEIKMDYTDLPSGIYYLMLNEKANSYIQKVVVNK
jgi:hypothetical protein